MKTCGEGSFRPPDGSGLSLLHGIGPVIVWQRAISHRLRGPFRGKFRRSFQTPIPFEPGKPDRITYNLPDIAHTFRQGHRIMVQIRSSWFPLTDRNPQKFMDIPKAQAGDFVKATRTVCWGGRDGPRFRLLIEG